MAEKNILSAIATNGSRLSDLPIKNGQLIFARDVKTIALDYDGKRTFYNQIVILESDQDRVNILAPVSGLFYFVMETTVLWTYRDNWIQITSPPKSFVFIGDVIPESGDKDVLYVDKTDKKIAVWDDVKSEFVTVADTLNTLGTDEILSLFF